MKPMLMDNVEIVTYTVEGSQQPHYFARNADGETFAISQRLAAKLEKADGTRRLRFSKTLLAKLKKRGLIRTSRFVRERGYNRFILFPIGERANKFQGICSVLNRCLPFAAVLVFALGMILKIAAGASYAYDFNVFVYYGLVAVSILLHEVGHLDAGLAYGYPVSELGILLLAIFPTGAYVAYEDKSEAPKSEQIQLALAGIEMNILLAGIFWLLSTKYFALSNTFATAGFMNVILAVTNLLPAEGLDGACALGVALGIENIHEAAKVWRFRKKHRKLHQSKGAAIAGTAIFGVSILSDVLMKVLTVLSILVIPVNIVLMIIRSMI